MWPFELVLLLYLVKIAGYVLLMIRRRYVGREDAHFGDVRYEPSVSILLPMYNEEEVVVKTIQNLLEITYDRFSIVVVDDGSVDNSYAIVQRHFGGDHRVRLIRQSNAGKSAALNTAMRASNGEIIISVDADTWVRPDMIKNIIPYFREETVAAVAGHIKVGNRVNLMTEMQYFEYISIWDNDRAFSDIVNGILIVPGALAAYRRSAVVAVGGFKSEVIAEDTELTLRLLYNNYVLRNATEAVAYTEAPDNLRMFFRQRVRWTTGLTQGLMKHNKRLFGHSNRWLSIVIMPFTWAFRVIFPLLLPLVDYYFIYACIFSHRYEALAWWPCIILGEGLITFYLLSIYRERVGFFTLLVVQRLYRHLLFFNYWLIFAKWTNGTLFSWGKITRKGSVQMESKQTMTVNE